MFQSFSGSSRRPRQVNLSGQDVDPFAASSWAPTASGTQKTLAAAQHERQQRQYERERLSATKRIQRTWRGHKVRKDLAESRRQIWDHIESEHAERQQPDDPSLAEELRLLLVFFDSTNLQDMARLDRFCVRFLQRSRVGRDFDVNVKGRLPRLAKVLLDALSLFVPPSVLDPDLRVRVLWIMISCPCIAFVQIRPRRFIIQANSSRSHPESSTQTMLQLLTSIAGWNPSATNRMITRYYEILSKLLSSEGCSIECKPTIFDAIVAPLVEHIDIEDAHRLLLDAYIGMAFSFLTTPDLIDKLDGMKALAAMIDIDLLSQAILQDTSISILGGMNPESRLWLLSHFICLHNLCLTHHQEPSYLRALSTILSRAASDIFGRIEASQPDSLDAPNEEEGSEIPIQPLPEFIRNQVISLVNKESLTGLLAKFDS